MEWAWSQPVIAKLMLFAVVTVFALAQPVSAQHYICEKLGVRLHFLLEIEDMKTGIPCSVSARTDYGEWRQFLHNEYDEGLCEERLAMLLGKNASEGWDCYMADPEDKTKKLKQD